MLSSEEENDFLKASTFVTISEFEQLIYRKNHLANELGRFKIAKKRQRNVIFRKQCRKLRKIL